jgi:translation initiation factor IF-3
MNRVPLGPGDRQTGPRARRAPTPGGASHATPPGVVAFRDGSGGAATHESHGEENAISVPGKSQEPRVNERIRIPQVRVIGDDGSQVGILSTREAIAMAQSKGLDLVEVAPTARPPVCKIMDYGKFKYEQNRASKAAKKKQHQMQLKEVKMRPKIEDHDYDFKLKHARTFLEQRDKVKFTVTFRGREMAHQELGYKIIEQVLHDLADVAVVEQSPRAEGRTVSLVLSPKAQQQVARPVLKTGAEKGPADGAAPAS